MSNPSSNPSSAPAKLRRTQFHDMPVPELLRVAGEVCGAGSHCPEVYGSRTGKQSLARLRQALTSANAAQEKKASLIVSLATASRALKIDYTVAGTALRAYETMAGSISGGEPSVLNEAGLVSSEDLPETLAVQRKVTGLRGRPGERAREARLSWKAARGAEGYAIQMRFGALDDPAGAWIDLGAGNRRPFRTVTAAVPGARFHVRVAALGRDGAALEWSDPLLVTAC